jgi:hypothetical protein
MLVSLTKIVGGGPAISGTLTNEQTIHCPICQNSYRFGYSDGEWHRVKDWLVQADRAIREDHKSNHELTSLTLV